ncbi:MAG: MFS transporter [Lachnospiraceae bacterium]|nr:MFS transporter [Lachnospiraceae bacterium]
MKNDRGTILASYLGFVVQGIVNNINPIFFVIYRERFGLSFAQVGALITVNFGVQILVDFTAAQVAGKLSYRKGMIASSICSFTGLCGIGCMAFLRSGHFAWILGCVILNAIGGGLLEVLASPLVEAVPSSSAKDKAMSLLHSFYCWGCLTFVGVSTILLKLLGDERWYIIPFLWAILPLLDGIAFCFVPIYTLPSDAQIVKRRSLFGNPMFLLLMFMMLMAGASEMGMSQWASYFAETGLGVDKTIGDLCGPCFFCLMMGLARLLFGRSGDRLPLRRFFVYSCLLGVATYLLAALSPLPWLGLLACGFCGLSVGIMWPGTYSIASVECKEGGTRMFAFLALAGDLGCTGGPKLVEFGAELFPEKGLSAGLLLGAIFPFLLLCSVVVLGMMTNKKGQ